MNLYFINRFGEERIVATCKDAEDVWKEINNFLEERNFKSYYSRLMYDSSIGRTIIDVGSHSEEFQVDENLIGRS